MLLVFGVLLTKTKGQTTTGFRLGGGPGEGITEKKKVLAKCPGKNFGCPNSW